jgi:hypothetical protein
MRLLPAQPAISGRSILKALLLTTLFVAAQYADGFCASPRPGYGAELYRPWFPQL